MASAQALAAEATPNQPANTIEATPQAGQSISHEGKQYTTIKEGLAYILVPHGIPTSTDPKISKEDSQKQQVFYNPIQQFNRDLSVLAIRTFGEELVAGRQQKKERGMRKDKQKRERQKRKLQDRTTDSGELTQDDERSSLSKKRMTEENGDAIALSDQPMLSTSGLTEPGAEIGQENSGGIRAVFAHALASSNPENMSNNSTSVAPKTPFNILDALSATGLRALRYAQEIPFMTSVTANDMSEAATDSISLNIKHNKLEDKIHANTGNAIAYMYSFVGQKGFDVIDLDPYGTAAPFIDAALQGLNDGGLLCVTCTDSAIFASHGYLEKTYSQYGGLPLKGEACHEGGIRLILHAVASSAARYGLAIEPLLSLSIDYYIRAFIRIRKSPNDVKLLASKTMMVYNCDSGCGAWSIQFLARITTSENRKGNAFFKHHFAQAPSANQLCEHCGHKTHLSGPMYGGPLHNTAFIEKVLAFVRGADRETYPTKDRIEGMLQTALEEMTYGAKSKKGGKTRDLKHLDPSIPSLDPAEREEHPFFFIPSALSRVIHCQAPPTAAIRGALRHAGFKVTMSHCKPGSIRTDASWRDIWHIMLEWVRQKAPLMKPLRKGTAGSAILSKGTADPDSYKSAKCIEAGKSAVERIEAAAADSEQGQEHGNDEVSGGSGDKGEREDAPPSYRGSNFRVVFDEELGKDHETGKYVRYQLAPRANWGPMSRAKQSQS
ncbi:TRM-domain-containing protein [Zopfia rhizophila CBS 207.26]|uniref:tRNA (guanine(26)-N(2))-dimethyltransferase n=1 Tax=Zopfia rhizophila CBS 207.26 TaxID=1314779 RepID=A0A6A6EJS5_9PEZI|nr:TRM-domain-containing protein [Zopfia rhizophila CBS 207.26]